jgi:hypothetical protein
MIKVFFDVDLDLPLYKRKSKTVHGKSLEKIEEIIAIYQTINLPPGAFYVALDSKFRRLFIYFNKAFETVHGPEIGQ